MTAIKECRCFTSRINPVIEPHYLVAFIWVGLFAIFADAVDKLTTMLLKIRLELGGAKRFLFRGLSAVMSVIEFVLSSAHSCSCVLK